ncbi:MAG: lipopolysaccharide biosynthesis protein [Betaproteobacteria bacterium]
MHMLGRDPRIMAACFRPTTEDLGGRVVRGAVWIAALVVLRMVLTIGSTAVLARLLVPADYGVIAMATVVTELASMLCMFGIPMIITQLPRLTRLDLDSAFWFSAILGTFMAALIVATSPLAAELFKEPGLAPVLCAMSLMVLLEEVSAVQLSITNRLLLVRCEFVCQISSLIVRIGVSVALAVAGLGVWSLVWGSVAGRAVYFALLWWFIPYVPRLRFNPRFLRRNWRVGGSYFDSAVLFFFGSNMDTAAVGRMFGVVQLGFYQTAFALPEELRSRIALAIQRVLFPAFALLQSDHSAFRYGLLRSLRILATIIVPMGVGMAVLADPIVRVLYGDRWLPVVPLLQFAAIVGIVRALQSFLGNTYRAKGRPDLEFKIGMALVPLLALAILIGSLWGIAGVAAGILVFSLVSLASTYFGLRLIQLGPLAVFQSLLPASAAAAFMGACLHLLDTMDAIPGSTALLELAASVAMGVLLFLLPLLLLSRKTLDDMGSVVRLLRTRQ